MGTNYLTLTSLCLNAREEWVNKDGGLTFVLPRGGSIKCVAGTFGRTLAAGDLLVLNGAGVKLCANGAGEVVFGFFSVRIEHIYPLLAPNEISLLRNVTDELKNPRLYPASDAMSAQCHRLAWSTQTDPSSPADLFSRIDLLRVAAAVLQAEFKNVRTSAAADKFDGLENHAIEVFEGLSADAILFTSPEELANKLHCSRRHLDRQFRRYFGISFNGLKTEIRLLKAASLLRDHYTKVINVAEESGFNHLGLFNTCFKKRFGVSPGEWRKRETGRSSAPTSLVTDRIKTSYAEQPVHILVECYAKAFGGKAKVNQPEAA